MIELISPHVCPLSFIVGGVVFGFVFGVLGYARGHHRGYHDAIEDHLDIDRKYPGREIMSP